MTALSPEAVAAVYAATRDQLVEQVRSVPDSATRMVPSCPQWSIKDVVAHVTGLVADILADVKGSLGTDEATSRQVGTRAEMSLPEICDEWQANADAIVAPLVATPLRGLGLTADLAVHVHDLAEMLDDVGVPPAAATDAGCARYVPLLQERAAQQLDLALTVTLDGQTWQPEAGSAPLTMTCTPTEFLRSVTGRRTRAQVEAFNWQGDPTNLLDQAFTQYGPFRTDG